MFFLEYFILLGKRPFDEELYLPHINLYFAFQLLVRKKEAKQDLVTFKHALADLCVERPSELSLELTDPHWLINALI